MATRTELTKQVAALAALQIDGFTWTISAGTRLKGRLNEDAEAVLLFSASGYAPPFHIMVALGPRFRNVEQIVQQAQRLTGLPEAAIRTGRLFPTIFEQLGSLSARGRHDYEATDGDTIIADLRSAGVPFLRRADTIVAAADYAMSHPLAHGHHRARIPVLLAMSGRRDEAVDYMRQESAADGVQAEYFADYCKALEPLL